MNFPTPPPSPSDYPEVVLQAIETIESASVDFEVNISDFVNSAGLTEHTYCLNLKKVRSVSLWPVQGTVFASKEKGKKGEKPRWTKPIRYKKLSPETATYVAIQVALTGTN